jgi:hypothetical protein
MRPDVAGYHKDSKSNGVTDFATMDMWIELKPKVAEPFKDPQERPPKPKVKKANTAKRPIFHHTSVKARETQGQLVAYANAVFCRQFRTRLFSVLICHDHARIILWDNSSAVVTESFSFITKPTLLAEFFWRYHCLPLVMRGYDTSVTAPSSTEQLLARKYLQINLNAKDPTFVKIRVPDDTSAAAEVKFFIAETPRFVPRSPFGRGTRGFVAWDVTEREIVWIKDYWRVNAEGMEKEGDIYLDLHRHGVPHIPKFGRAGDIKSNELCTTSNDRWVNETWACRTKESRTYTLYRVVLNEVGRDLISFDSSWEYTHAIADAVHGDILFFTFCFGMLIALQLTGWRTTKPISFTATLASATCS